jgi:ADP-ribosyl-[dinitrogen reductase] hydrolase
MLADRFRGSLVGLAVGDALGAPLEGMSAEEIARRHGRVSGYVDAAEDSPEKWRLRGLHTDDTQQALIVTEAILQTGRADPDVIVRMMVELTEGPRTVPFGAHRGTGRSYRLSVMRMRHEGRWSSGSRSSAGIGASMRVAPVGLFFTGDDAAIRENASLSALVTHTDPRGCLAACAVAYLAGRASRSFLRPFTPAELHADTLVFLRRAETWFMDLYGGRSHPDVRQTYGQFGDALEAIAGAWDRESASVLPRILEKGSALAGTDLGHPLRGVALTGVVAAIYLFLRYRERYRDALLEVLNAGGDTDSVGAIVGALCGAAGGEEAIPAEWRDGLLALEQVRLRADALAGEPIKEHRVRPLAELELELTLEEDRQRRAKFLPGTFPDAYEWEEPVYLPPEPEPAPEPTRPPERPPRGGRRFNQRRRR